MNAQPPVVVGPTVQAPTVLPTVRAGAPVTLNATRGRAGLWTGDGPPGDVPGAASGDEYLDTTTGTLYRLGA